MIFESIFGYGGFALIIWYGLSLGILHTLMPCEDKFIFCFYAFGVARDWKQAMRIVNYYGFGLFTMNFIIGGSLAGFGAILGTAITPNRFVWNAISSFSLIISGIVMLLQIKRKKYWPHGDQLQDLTESLSTLRKRKRTAFLLGLLAGIPPCIFEIAVYLHAVTFSVQYGWGIGVWTIAFFGIGTWLGLYPLAFLGTMSGSISKALQDSRLQKIQAKLNFNQLRKKFSRGGSEKVPEINSPSESDSEIIFSPAPSKIRIYSKIEIFSAWALIIFGVLYFILAVLGIDIIPVGLTPT